MAHLLQKRSRFRRRYKYVFAVRGASLCPSIRRPLRRRLLSFFEVDEKGKFLLWSTMAHLLPFAAVLLSY